MTQTMPIKNTVFEQETKTPRWKFVTVFILCISGVFTILSTPPLFLFGTLGFLFFGLLGAIVCKRERAIFTTPLLFLMRAWLVSFYLATFFFMGHLLGKGLNLFIIHDAALYSGALVGIIAGIITLAVIIKKICK